MPDLIGRTLLNRYRVVERINRGGMAEVYKVWDNQRATYLALKLLREGLSRDPVLWNRFRAEAKTLESLDHPNIVRFFGLEQDGPLIFILMEYVEGNDLKAEIQQNIGAGLSPQRVLFIMRPLCGALHFAHQLGKVHCDIKPANILLGQNTQVYLADFGVADMVEGTSSNQPHAGTPYYMAPEQVRGDTPVPQTDIYALGVLLYEMLTGGKLPFYGDKAPYSGAPKEKVFWEQINLQPAPMRSHGLSISQEFEAIVGRCLGKDPLNRYRSTMDLLADLEKAASAARAVEYQPEAGHRRVEDQQATGDLFPSQVPREKPVVVGRTPSHFPGWIIVVLGGILVLVVFAVVSGGFQFLFRGQTHSPDPYRSSLPEVTAPQPGTMPTTRIAPSSETPAPTRTPSPNRTATPTLSSTQYYAVHECMTVTIKRPEGTAQTIECVTGVTVLSDGNMIVLFSWTAHTGDKFYIDKRSDSGNTNIYLTDDLGNHYDHTQTAGAARDRVVITDGQTVEGWFLFPALAPGARFFIFHDDDNYVQTSPIILRP